MCILKKISFVAVCVLLLASFSACSIFPETTTAKPPTTQTITQESTTSAAEHILTGTVINAPGTVNIRSEPNSKCEILGTSNNGEIFVVLKEFYTASWHQIEYEGRAAYIFKDYFQINELSAIVTTESSAFSPFFTTTTAPTTATTSTTSIKPTATTAPTTVTTSTTSVKPTSTIAPTTTVRPTTSVPATTVESSDYGYVVKNREQILGMLKILMLDLQTEILFDIRACTESSYKDIDNIIKEASADIELETGIADIYDKWLWKYEGGQMTINIDYEYTQAQLDQTVSKAKSVVEGIINKNPGASDYVIELEIHDYIVNNTVYDKRYFDNKTEPVESHTAYGPLVLGTSVCEGYAEAMNLLCYYAGIECLMVEGYAGGDHAWNIVNIDHAYYQVDLTWDDPTQDDGTQTLRHLYFNISDAKMTLDHDWDAAAYPKCVSMTCNYYYMKGLVVKNLDELKARLQTMMSNKQSGIELLMEGYTSAAYQNVVDTIYNTIYAKGSAATNYLYNIKGTLGIITISDVRYK
jgi:hypothetical protein